MLRHIPVANSGDRKNRHGVTKLALRERSRFEHWSAFEKEQIFNSCGHWCWMDGNFCSMCGVSYGRESELMPTSRNSATGKVQACSTRPRREWDGSVSKSKSGKLACAANRLSGHPKRSTSSLAGSKRTPTPSVLTEYEFTPKYAHSEKSLNALRCARVRVSIRRAVLS